MIKVIPGWGSLVGATTSFASTYAVGVVMHKHFQNAAEGKLDMEALKAEFEAAQKEGKETYKAKKGEIEAKEKEMRDGTFKPFTGPISDQSGKLRIPAASPDRTTLESTDYLVEGVVGKIPSS